MSKKHPSIRTRPQRQADERRLRQLMAEMRNNPLLAIALHEMLGDGIPKMTYPELYVEAIYDDREWYPVMRCPRCKSSLGEGDIVAVDVSTRETEGTPDADEQEVSFNYDEPEDYHGLYYKHDGCGPVKVPEGWEV